MSIRRRCGPSPRRPRIGALIAPDSSATVSDHCASLSDTWKSLAISGMSGAPREETTATISVTTTSTGVRSRSRSDSARIDGAVSVLTTALPGAYRRVTPASATLLNRRKPPFPGQEYRRATRDAEEQRWIRQDSAEHNLGRPPSRSPSLGSGRGRWEVAAGRTGGVRRTMTSRSPRSTTDSSWASTGSTPPPPMAGATRSRSSDARCKA